MPQRGKEMVRSDAVMWFYRKFLVSSDFKRRKKIKAGTCDRII